jgi:nicotinate-nucleotide pyrophosphorylase (carboxylating)
VEKEFRQIQWNDQLEADWHALLRLAATEDLADLGDLTTRALVKPEGIGHVAIVAREGGIIAGLAAVEMTAQFFDPRLEWTPMAADGQKIEPGDRLGTLEGPAEGILTAERTILNLLGRLSGIASLTAQYVDQIEGTGAKIYDTRKTTPGLRRLEKYAVRSGGGTNHRHGLYEAILIKDNHLAFGAETTFTPAEAVEKSRRFIDTHLPQPLRAKTIVEIEVDTLEQLEEVLPVGPDIVLLDNMSPEQLAQAVARRDAVNRSVELEASGGVNLETVRRIAQSGVDRISVGALTHSAVNQDLGFDWF